MEQYAAAGYCPGNNNSPGTKLTCTSGVCPLVEAANTNTVIEFQNSLVTDVTGYVALDHTNKLVVVSFRGTQSVRNYLADAMFPEIPTDICNGCTAAQGFWLSWLESRARVLAAIESTADQYGSYKIAVTGHSLGGAIAAFAAAQLRNDGYSVALYSYGSPRIGGPTISQYISNQPGGNYRVTHTNDLIPRLPPTIAGFRHITPEYYISSGNNVPVTPADITRFNDDHNSAGNAGHLIPSVTAHGWYFNSISACYPGGGIEVKRSWIVPVDAEFTE
ncbi:alpha/beta-hydrolase [Patellaria atrata CBS 101060]|uniref:Alpha/beta-hydrolase n=1 Tax=Patellaria atrata CBS 101060 TaxID=1346257 RepID=A0A9P4SD74_9PEZI|nr:alpha/beta-hydrolase [Patellaria atrata CBS 101060]